MRRLAEIVDDADCCESLDWIFDVVQVFSTVVGEVVEDVYTLYCCFSSLLATEDEIDPLVEMATDV